LCIRFFAPAIEAKCFSAFRKSCPNLLPKKERGEKSEGGYSIVEIAVVLLIAMIITSMSLVIFRRARSQYDLRQKAEKLVSEIELARSLAIKYNQTLTLGFTSSNTLFGLTCDCPDAMIELVPTVVPSGLSLSAYPTMQIRGNGTIQSSNGTITVTSSQKYQVTITVSNSGRTTIGDVKPVS
jgi:Type II transport protein GspH